MSETAMPGHFDAREQVHVAARKASEAGSANVLACAFPEWRKGHEGHVVACSIYCDEQAAALVRAHDVGAAGAQARIERLENDRRHFAGVADTARAEITRLSGDVAALNARLAKALTRGDVASRYLLIRLDGAWRDCGKPDSPTCAMQFPGEAACWSHRVRAFLREPALPDAPALATTPVPPGAGDSK